MLATFVTFHVESQSMNENKKSGHINVIFYTKGRGARADFCGPTPYTYIHTILFTLKYRRVKAQILCV
jgi:hypothetical protein